MGLIWSTHPIVQQRFRKVVAFTRVGELPLQLRSRHCRAEWSEDSPAAGADDTSSVGRVHLCLVGRIVKEQRRFRKRGHHEKSVFQGGASHLASCFQRLEQPPGGCSQVSWLEPHALEALLAETA